MPMKCIICKAEQNPFYKRTFHRFPKNESTRQKWIDSINLSTTPNFKIACVCSDHFDKESFFDHHHLRKRQRLCPEAVPKLKTKQSAITSNNNCDDVKEDERSRMNASTDPVDPEESNPIQDLSLQSRLDTDLPLESSCNRDSSNNYNNETANSISNCDANDMIKNRRSLANTCTNPLDSEESNPIQDLSLQSRLDTDKKIELPLEESRNRHSSNDCNIKTVNNSTSNDQSITKKKTRKPVTRVRFMTGFQTEYVYREDFVSEEAWNRFIRYSVYKTYKTAAAHNRNARNQNKIKKLKAVISILKQKIPLNI